MPEIRIAELGILRSMIEDLQRRADASESQLRLTRQDPESGGTNRIELCDDCSTDMPIYRNAIYCGTVKEDIDVDGKGTVRIINEDRCLDEAPVNLEVTNLGPGACAAEDEVIVWVTDDCQYKTRCHCECVECEFDDICIYMDGRTFEIISSRVEGGLKYWTVRMTCTDSGTESGDFELPGLDCTMIDCQTYAVGSLGSCGSGDITFGNDPSCCPTCEFDTLCIQMDGRSFVINGFVIDGTTIIWNVTMTCDASGTEVTFDLPALDCTEIDCQTLAVGSLGSCLSGDITFGNDPSCCIEVPGGPCLPTDCSAGIQGPLTTTFDSATPPAGWTYPSSAGTSWWNVGGGDGIATPNTTVWPNWSGSVFARLCADTSGSRTVTTIANITAYNIPALAESTWDSFGFRVYAGYGNQLHQSGGIFADFASEYDPAIIPGKQFLVTSSGTCGGATEHQPTLIAFDGVSHEYKVVATYSLDGTTVTYTMFFDTVLIDTIGPCLSPLLWIDADACNNVTLEGGVGFGGDLQSGLFEGLDIFNIHDITITYN